jgi:hypothetical protein
MTHQAASPVLIEHGESPHARRLRENRLRIALALTALEAILVIAGAIPWWIVVLAAAAALVVYASVRHRTSSELVQLAWIAAFSQVTLVLVPVAAALLTVLAIVVVVVFAVLALVALARDHR